MRPLKYSRKRFDVEAIPVSAANMAEVAEWCKGEIVKAVLPKLNRKSDSVPVDCIKVPVLRPLNERQTKAFVGDWVVKAGAGFKVWTDKAFNEGFEPAETTVFSAIEAE